MEHEVYRALDRPSSFLGIKGKFIVVIGVFAGVFAVLGLLTGALFGSGLAGLGVFFGGVIIGYLVVLILQGRMSVRQFSRFLSSRKTPQYIKVPPRRLVEKVKFFED